MAGIDHGWAESYGDYFDEFDNMANGKNVFEGHFEMMGSESAKLQQIYNYLHSFASKNLTKDDIKGLQDVLNRELVNIEPSDSVFGAYRSFDKPLEVDGIFGPETKKYFSHFATEVSGLHSDESASELIQSIENNLGFGKSKDIGGDFMMKSADAVFNVINTPAGKAMLPQAQMLNVIDRVIEGSMTQDEMDSLGLTAKPGGKPSKQY
jgi:hypothetical protein